MSKALNRITLLFWLVVVGHIAWTDGACLAVSPDGWFGVDAASGYDFSRDANVKRGGEASMLIRSTAEMPANPGAFAQFIRADKFRGKRVRLNGFMKSEAVEQKAGLWMRIDADDSFGVQYGNTQQDHAVSGTSDWGELEIVLDVPQNASVISFGGLLTGKGKAWVDDMALTVVGNDVATTGFPVRPQPPKKKGVLPASEDIINAGFEK